MSHKQAIHHLQQSRANNSRNFVEQVRYHEQEEKKAKSENQRRQVEALLKLQMK